jgi:uncharacterized protein (UPF0261 family)
MDCAVLEFTRDTVPEKYRERKLFFDDFRSAIRLSNNETELLAKRLANKLNMDADNVQVLIPANGFSDADRENAPLYDTERGRLFIETLKQSLDHDIVVQELNLHINDPAFGNHAAHRMDELIQRAKVS